MPAVGDEGLAAIEQVTAVWLGNRSGLDALQVRAGRRFAHGNGTNHFTRRQLGQVLGLLLGRAVVQYVGRHNFAVQAVANAADPGTCQLFKLYH